MVLLRIIDAKLSMSTRNEFAVFIWILGYQLLHLESRELERKETH
jgi:hypothetical protein